MELMPEVVEPGRIVRLQGGIPILFQGSDLLFDAGFINARRCLAMMQVSIQIKSVANGDQQVLLVHLRVTLHCIMLHPRGHFPQFCDGLFFEFFIGMGHSGHSLEIRKVNACHEIAWAQWRYCNPREFQTPPGRRMPGRA
jgi:hypothetical protein